MSSRTSTKAVVIKSLVLLLSFVATIAVIVIIRGNPFQDSADLTEAKTFDWCSGKVEYVRVSRSGQPPIKIESGAENLEVLCSVEIMGYQPSKVDESAFVPVLLVRFEDGGQQVIEYDQVEHYRLAGIIFRSQELDQWLSEH